MSSLKIIHDQDRCIGCHACVNLAPQNWDMNENGKAQLICGTKKGRYTISEIFECDLEANQSAAQACPMNIIKVVQT